MSKFVNWKKREKEIEVMTHTFKEKFSIVSLMIPLFGL